MIVKELEPQTHTDPLRRAGYDAEQQMAHYLKRAFGDDPLKSVFHNLRIRRLDEVAQLDHLILHRFGIVIVESKSVSGQVAVNEQGEWTRWWNRQGRGMPSPVLQARRQMDLLVALLQDHSSELLDRTLFGLKQRQFAGMRRDVLVAISDQGRISRKSDVPELVKADQVPERVLEIVKGAQERGLGAFSFSDAELIRLQAFLRTRHQPLETQASPVQATPVQASPVPHHTQPPAAAPRQAPVPPRRPAPGVRATQEQQAPSRPSSEVVCRHCGSERLSVQFGKYGYYLKCAACAGNTPTRPQCAECGQPAKVSKRGSEFTASCPAGHSWLYWVNPAG
ncbi:nuclease-related domain-containing protein [Deinococcus koreensis]|uniref:NERD domain-containing protein n=1 Tax=Deinococcus koreensis TaxID=2054903 RepID=A0A2K3UU33_9DEIO|nr:nuclease-related domain-containing protein [Deinococcus koreensis]PNY80041.1 hypothetical protein CVO96_00545 [Deinococcus koreensis]